MGLLNRLFNRKSEEDEEAYASVVMLLRSPSTLTDEHLKAAAAKAYKSFEYAGIVSGTRAIVVKATILTVQSKSSFYFDPEQDKAAAATDVFARAWA
jgi:hypothetical protein